MWLHKAFLVFASSIPAITIICGVVFTALGLTTRKSNKIRSKKWLRIGMICLCVIIFFLLVSILGAISSGTLSI